MLNILVPMAGDGSRFAEVGYTFPKPLIEIYDKPMIQWVIESLSNSFEHKFIFLVRAEHIKKYNIEFMLNVLTKNNCEIIIVREKTLGAACTALLAENFINNDNELIIANSDQFMICNFNKFITDANNYDGSIITFKAAHPKWSYAKIENYLVTEVAEKKPISNNASIGIYYWKKGSDFVKYAKQMINKNITTNNEFYICPVYNEAIQDNKKITAFNIQQNRFWGLGTPEDVENFYRTYRYE